MSRIILFRSANELNSCLAQLMAQPFNLVVRPCPPRSALAGAAGVVIDLDSMKEEDRKSETVRAVVTSMSTGCPVAVVSAALDNASCQALVRRGVMVYWRLEEGVFHDLSWKLNRKRARRAA
jgi:hypothetical protein